MQSESIGFHVRSSAAVKFCAGRNTQDSPFLIPAYRTVARAGRDGGSKLLGTREIFLKEKWQRRFTFYALTFYVVRFGMGEIRVDEKVRGILSMFPGSYRLVVGVVRRVAGTLAVEGAMLLTMNEVCDRIRRTVLKAVEVAEQAAKIEVGKNAPLFQGLNLLDDGLFDLVADVQELVAPAGSIGEDHHEENCRLSAPIVSKRGNDADHMRCEVLRGSRYCGLESGLVYKRRGNVHHSIIARPTFQNFGFTILGGGPASAGVVFS